MNACPRHRFFGGMLLVLMVSACATGAPLRPIEKMSPQKHAQQIYQILIAREGRSQPRDPRTLSGFPEAPTEVAQQLETLAASRYGKEREALLDLAQALRRLGLYSQVLFRAKADDVTVKYKALARTEAQSAHTGWNNLPIGFYEVWGERKGKVVSAVNEYDILQQKVVIDVVVE
jgi:hypothetical protein